MPQTILYAQTRPPALTQQFIASRGPRIIISWARPRNCMPPIQYSISKWPSFTVSCWLPSVFLCRWKWWCPRGGLIRSWSGRAGESCMSWGCTSSIPSATGLLWAIMEPCPWVLGPYDRGYCESRRFRWFKLVERMPGNVWVKICDDGTLLVNHTQMCSLLSHPGFQLFLQWKP